MKAVVDVILSITKKVSALQSLNLPLTFRGPQSTGITRGTTLLDVSSSTLLSVTMRVEASRTRRRDQEILEDDGVLQGVDDGSENAKRESESISNPSSR